MAKSKIEKIDKQKLDLSKTLYAIDTKDKFYYDRLSEDEKKKYTALILMRFMSSAPDQGNLHEYHLNAINDIVNQDFWSLSKHPELLHKLLCMCGTGQKLYHQWIKSPAQKAQSNAVKNFFKRIYPELNNLETEILIKNYSEEDFETILKEYGVQDKELKELCKKYKKIKDDSE